MRTTGKPVPSDQERVQRLARFVMSDTIGPEFLSSLARIERALVGFEHALIGGQAVFYSGYERFSGDIDVGVIRPVRDAAAALVKAGFRLREGARFVDPDTQVEVDVVKLPRVTIPYVKTPRRVDAGPGLVVPVLPLPALMALKMKVGRLKDEADVIELLKAGAVPDRDEVVRILRGLGETAEGYDRLVLRAKTEPR